MKTIIFLLSTLLFTNVYAQNIQVCKNEQKRTYGICNGNSIIEPQEYSRLNFSKEDNIFYGYKVVNINNVKDEAYKSYGFNKNGQKIFEVPGYIGEFESGIASIKFNSGFRFLNSGPKEIMEDPSKLRNFKTFLMIDEAFFNITAIVNKIFMLNEPIYDGEISRMEEKTKIGYINTKGEMIIKPIYRNDETLNNFKKDFGYGIASTEKNKYGLINKTGDIVIPLEYKEVYLLNGKLILYKEECGFVKCKGLRTSLDKKTLTGKTETEINRYKIDLINYFIGTKFNTDEKRLGLLFTLAIVLSLLLIPFCILYQKYKRKEILSKSMWKGILWAFVIGFTSVIGTILALICFVFVFFGANMLGVVMSQNDK